MDELEWVCGRLPEARARAIEEGWGPELARVLDDVRDGTRPVTAVVEVVYGHLGLPVRPRGYAPVPGQEPAPPPPGTYICPGRHCSRTAVREPGGPLPECLVFDEPMSFR
ncbi:hypothetical protein [Streptomyces sp. JB150]|uniref:hypothetical protein n=1 Tax=Streptomyces sp. JB150 TaxID=2714844 RepID=UPI001408A655|nr:hypothetical protein [Streptomyces sp. JB150]QIJ61003.1 hypothetical protein G7Z13_02345 [Streptomyces sp. JB150]